MKKIAVLLAAYNGSCYIKEQISSIKAQIGVSIDIYIRDDAGNEATYAEIRTLIDEKSVNFSSDNSRSGSPAGNFFRILSEINLEEYDFVAFSDQDDVWFPSKLVNAIDAIEIEAADAYSSDLIAFDNDGRTAWYLGKSNQQKKFDYLFQGASAGCTYVLTRKAASLVREVLGENARCFPPAHSHDWLIYAICRSHGLKWHHDNRALIAYRQHSVNAFGAMPGISGLLQRLQLSRSGWYREQIVWQGQFLVRSPSEFRILGAVKNCGIKDRLYLVMHILNFRRSTKDCFLLAVVILLGLL